MKPGYSMAAETSISLAFVSSAYNEEKNLELLYQRCRSAHRRLCSECYQMAEAKFHFIIADNASTDQSVSVMHRLCQEDPSITLLVNRKNYGPEASVANVLKIAKEYDLIVLLCSDLQDPPELAVAMVKSLFTQASHDAVLAIKERSIGNCMLRVARRCYYKALGYSTRLQKVPGGFHGFGCYQRDVIEDALQYWEQTDLNLRQCLANACHSPSYIGYEQADRVHGVSSYKGWGYWSEAFRSLAAGDASASRLALLIGTSGMVIGVITAILLAFNVLRGNSGYGGGIPTVMALVLLSFTLQMLMFGLVSRQIEALRMGGLRPKVSFRTVDHSVAAKRTRQLVDLKSNES